MKLNSTKKIVPQKMFKTKDESHLLKMFIDKH